MKKILASLSLVALLLASCSAPQQKTFVERHHFHGDIVSITDSVWSASEWLDKVHQEQLQAVIQWVVNAEGQLDSYAVYNAEGGLLNQEVNEWSDRYRLNTVNQFGLGGKLRCRSVYIYEGDRLDTIVNQYDTQEVEFLVHRYEAGRLATVEGTMAGRSKVSRFSFLSDGSYTVMDTSYDGQTTTDTYNADGQIVRSDMTSESWQQTYNDDGLLIQTTHTAPFRCVVDTYEYTFDTHGNWTTSIRRRREGDKAPSVDQYTQRTIVYR